MRIKVVVESMPRCGTHYLIRNLMQSYDLGYCTIYPAAKRKGQIKRMVEINGSNFVVTFDAGATWYIQDGGHNVEWARINYVCKTHFTNPIPESSIAPKIYLWGDPLDYVWLSARMWSEKRHDPHFKLTANNEQYKKRVEPHLDRLEKWLDRITILQNAVRYEDLLYHQARSIEKIESICFRKIPIDKWIHPELKPHRIIFSGWEDKIDKGLAKYLIKRFDKYIFKGESNWAGI